MSVARFRFDPNLIATLGQQYRSSEEAIKELVANAWDADATRVDVFLPEPMTSEPIVIADNGNGMSPTDIQNHFLTVGYDRRQTRGDTTSRGRMVRGARGIGKFAGLQVAETMTITTVVNSSQSTLTLNGDSLRKLADTLEVADIQIDVVPADTPPGTRVVLLGLRQSFAFPSPEELSRLLLREFARQDDFAIYINGEQLSLGALDGRREDATVSLEDGNTICGTVWITDKPRAVKDPGIIIRVNGRAVGAPTFFDLDKDPDIPKSLLSRVAGEIHADHLKDDTMANWAEFIENSTGYKALVEGLRAYVRRMLVDSRNAEAGSAPEEFVESFSEEIERLPRPRRELARDALYRVFRRFYDDSVGRKRVIAELVLNAFERDEYWLLVERIDEMAHVEIAQLADILVQWGLYEVGEIARRARRRLAIVERFEKLVWDDNTLELRDIHRIIERQVWLLGDEYELASSNTTLRNLVEQVLKRRYRGRRESERPDLLLAGTADRYLLVELKRPNHQIDRGDVAQVQKYRDEIRNHHPLGRIDTVVIGRRVEPALARDDRLDCRVTTFSDVLTDARRRLEWLISNLETEADGTDDVPVTADGL